MTVADPTVRPEALDYLSGLTLQPADLPAASSWQQVALPARKLELVEGVGLQPSALSPLTGKDQPSPFATEALLAGLAGERIPFAFQVVGGPDGVRFMVGTWADAAGAGLDQQHAVVTSLLDGLYPAIDRRPAEDVEVKGLPLGGIVQGVPMAAVHGSETPWDRLLRGLQGSSFAVLVLAEPIEPQTIVQLRDVALDDVRAALAAEDPTAQSPLTKAYVAQAGKLVDSLNRALTAGAWRTGVYVLGDRASYWRLAAAWRGAFSDGDATLPLNVAPSNKAPDLAEAWALPYQPAPQGPRGWQYPFMNQTLLDTAQLATCAHFPRIDSPGFSVRPAPAFAVSHRPPDAGARVLEIGDVLAQQRKTGTSYLFDVDQLTRHAFVAGLTGSGKTNTLMHLLSEAADLDVPFLVIEPAKTEYRELLGRKSLKDRLRVFTVGREQVSPLRINPFEVPEGIDVSTHLDLLKAVFMASFAMWIPLPQVLEQCLVQLYTERGWDFATGDHKGGRAAMGPNDIPTIADLVASVERTVPTLGYKDDTTQEIGASLTTRLNALRRGTRGLMLDVERSIPMEELLGGPTIIELEGLGDDGDKAFVMGLILVRLYEHRRAENAARLAAAAAKGKPAPPAGGLAHIVVMEEAHRLVAQSKGPVDSWHADPQGAFADAFSQMLSEIRAYGQAMVIADQVPVRLAPDVLKNTNLKIVHRLVAGDDRTAMAEAMSMDKEQANLLSVLPRGRAAVFSEGDHTPVIVDVVKAKNLDDAPAIDDAAVAKAMAKWRAQPDIAPVYVDSQFCAGVCPTPSACRQARALAESQDGRLLAGRLFTGASADGAGLDAAWPDVTAFVSARTANDEEIEGAVHSFALHAFHVAVSRRATQAQWPVDAIDQLTVAARDVVAERVASKDRWLGPTKARKALMKLAAGLQQRAHDPFPLCRAVCSDGTCRYRDAIADALTHPRHTPYSADPSSQPDQAAYVMQVATLAANDVVSTDPEAPTADALNEVKWQAVACAGQVKFCTTDHPQSAASLIASALAGAGWTLALDKTADQTTSGKGGRRS